MPPSVSPTPNPTSTCAEARMLCHLGRILSANGEASSAIRILDHAHARALQAGDPELQRTAVQALTELCASLLQREVPQRSDP